LKGPCSVLEMLVIASVGGENAIETGQTEGWVLTRRCRLLDDSRRSRYRLVNVEGDWVAR